MLMPRQAVIPAGLLRTEGLGRSVFQGALGAQQGMTGAAALPSSDPQQMGDRFRSVVTARATNEHAQNQRMFDAAAGVVQAKSTTLPADMLAKFKLEHSLIPGNGDMAKLAAMIRREA